MSNKQKALIFILLASIFGGAVMPVVKIGLVDIPPLSFVFLRFLVAGVIISPFLFKKNFIVPLRKLASLSLLGTLNIILAVFGIQRTISTSGQLLYAGVPLLTALFLFIILKERLKWNKTIGIVIGFLGVIFLVLLPAIEKGSELSGDLPGNVLLLSGVVSWSLYMVFSKRALKSFSPFIVTAVFIWITCITTFPFFIIELSIRSGWWEKLTPSGILSVGFSGFFATVATFMFSQYAIKYGGSVLASLQFYLLPIVTYLSASVLLGEHLTLGIVIGGALALLGVYITTKK